MLDKTKKIIRKNSEIIVVIFGILVLLTLFFWPIIWQNKTLMPNQYVSGMTAQGPYNSPELFIPKPYADPGASAWNNIPLFELVLQEYRAGRWPLWNPFSGLGMPLAANLQSGAWHLPQLLFAGFGALNMHWDAYFLFRIFLAILFAYLFARKIKLTPLGAAVAGVVFGLNTFFILYLTNTNLNIVIFLPLLLLLVEYNLEKPSKKRLIAFISILFLSITGGHPEATFFNFLTGYGYGLFRLCQLNNWTDYKKSFYSSLRLLLLPMLIALGLSGFFLLPFLEYVALSFNVHTAGDQIGLETKFIMLTGWVTNFLALMAIWGVRRKSRQRQLIILLTAVIFFYYAKAVGFPAFNIIGYLPILNQINFPLFLAPSALLAIAILAGLGAEKINWRGLALATPVLALLSLNLLRPELAFIGIIVLSILVGAIFKSEQTSRSGHLVKIGLLVMLLAIQTIRTLPESYPNRLDPFAPPASADFLKQQAGILPARIFSNSHVFIPHSLTPLRIADLRFVDALSPKLFTKIVHNIAQDYNPIAFFGRKFPLDHDILKNWGVNFIAQSDAGNPDIITISTLNKLINSRDGLKSLPKDSLLYLGPEKFVTKVKLDPVPGELVFKNEVADIYQLRDTLPRGRVYYNYIIEPNTNKAIAALSAENWDYQTQVILSRPPADFEPSAGRLYTPAEIVDYQPQYIKIKAENPASGILALSETFYPGWKAKIDGQDAEILRANVAERAIALPAGNHIIEFSYQPKSYFYGLLISLIAFLLLLARLYFFKKKNPA